MGLGVRKVLGVSPPLNTARSQAYPSMFLGLCAHLVNAGGGLNRPRGPFQPVLPVQEEKGDMQRYEVNHSDLSLHPNSRED